MLHGIREGVIAFDRGAASPGQRRGAAAARPLGHPVRGCPIEELVPAGRLRDVLTGQLDGIRRRWL